ncbi:MAG: hypothetical protein P3C12_05215 [Gemmatimonadota bacterium]|nr:hypothetical protein [Gemmatimonadota bacterium]
MMIAAVLAGAVVGPTPLPAQAVAGVGDDAIPLPKGSYRLLASGLWNDWDAVFGAGGATTTPLFGTLNTAAAGVAIFPRLASAEAGLRALTGQSGFALSMGSLDASGEVRQSIAPLGVSYGVTRRLSLRLLVPYVESRDIAELLFNRVGSTANVGINPAFATGTGTTARASNGAVLSQIDLARSTLSAELARCAATAATGCNAIRANASSAQALLLRAASTRSAIATVYGDATRGGAPVVPITGGTAQTAVRATIAALRSDFATFGITSIADGAAPAGATTVYGPGGMAQIAKDTAWKLGYERLGNTRRAGIGDIDLTASFLLYDSFGADQAKRLLSGARGVRSMVTGGWRFGTAGADRTDDPFDVPIGEGANALLLRSTTDLVLSRSIWISATVRAAKPLVDNVAVALPSSTDTSPFAPFTVWPAARTLGTRMDVELAPRLAIGQFFGLSGAYLLRRWGTDSYQPAASDGNLAPGSTDVPTRTVHAAAFGATFSTLSSYVRGRSRWPAEVIFTHTIPLRGSGALAPAAASDRLELRVYTGFPRR